MEPEFLRSFTLIDRVPAPPQLRSKSIIAAADELPVACESVDVLILPHIIEFEPNRQQILNEAERVLKPEGRLFILGINPWNPHGIMQKIPRESAASRNRYVSSHRMLDWLGLMKFEAEFSAAFNLSTSEVLAKPDSLWDWTRAELSFAYAIKAIKRRYTLIPLKPQWINAPSLAAGHMFEKSKTMTTHE